jgi:phospholipid/cholesterol/gamma-HCH transport system permease protein
MRSRIEPMKNTARSLRQHRELILNYFRAQKLLSSGVVEGLNNKVKVTMRKSYGFRTFRRLELALYTHLASCPSRNRPMNSSDEPFFHGKALLYGTLQAALQTSPKTVARFVRLDTLYPSNWRPTGKSSIECDSSMAETSTWPQIGGKSKSGASALGLLSGLFEWFGELGMFCVRVARVAFTPPYEWRELLRQMDIVGSQSMPLVALAGAATGVVLALETTNAMDRFGAKSLLPAVIVFSIVKESGPIITGLVMSGRAGAGIGAELGSMKVTEQIDAMQASAVDPDKYLAATRILACILMLPLLTLAADFCGVFTGWVAVTLTRTISLQLFLNTGFKNVDFSDFIPPVLKTAVFGFIIGLVSCFQGMRTSGDTAGVGRAATSSVVLSSLFVILADVVLVRLILIYFS